MRSKGEARERMKSHARKMILEREGKDRYPNFLGRWGPYLSLNFAVSSTSLKARPLLHEFYFFFQFNCVISGSPFYVESASRGKKH